MPRNPLELIVGVVHHSTKREHELKWLLIIIDIGKASLWNFHHQKLVFHYLKSDSSPYLYPGGIQLTYLTAGAYLMKPINMFKPCAGYKLGPPITIQI